MEKNFGRDSVQVLSRLQEWARGLRVGENGGSRPNGSPRLRNTTED
jgi:hypothetical protein